MEPLDGGRDESYTSRVNRRLRRGVSQSTVLGHRHGVLCRRHVGSGAWATLMARDTASRSASCRLRGTCHTRAGPEGAPAMSEAIWFYD